METVVTIITEYNLCINQINRLLLCAYLNGVHKINLMKIYIKYKTILNLILKIKNKYKHIMFLINSYVQIHQCIQQPTVPIDLVHYSIQHIRIFNVNILVSINIIPFFIIISLQYSFIFVFKLYNHIIIIFIYFYHNIIYQQSYSHDFIIFISFDTLTFISTYYYYYYKPCKQLQIVMVGFTFIQIIHT